LVNLYHRIEGKGEAILFLPGLGLNHHLFDDIANFLKGSYTIILTDLYGTGKSPKPEEKYSFIQDAQKVYEIVKDFKMINVIGHSRGVKIALCLYEHYKNFGKIIFVGQAGFGKNDDRFTKNALEVKKLKLSTKTEIAKKLEQGLNFGKIYGGTETLLKLKKAKEGCDIADTLLRRVEDSPDYLKIAKEIENEVHFIIGANDPFYDDIKEATKIYKRPKIYEISECGHFPMIEKATQFNSIVKKILEGG